ncbi:MAG: creatininase family protein [Gemmatimonadota bacterium]
MADAAQRPWYRYEELRPDQLARVVEESPVAFWPLGLLEHHGWHLPVGFDGLKADRMCQRLAARVGGVILPVMWWGGGGGHGAFRWTHYQDTDASGAVLATVATQLVRHGFRALVLLAGHYPWQSLLDQVVPPLREQHPEVLVLCGTELTIGGDQMHLPGDHAAREETSYGLALLPELVDLGALRPGRGREAWPGGHPPPSEGRHPGVGFDPSAPLFSQLGEDARLATAARGEEAIDRLVNHLTCRLQAHLGQS